MSLQDFGSGINKNKFISEAIKTCSAVIIGASNGLSISEGYNIFAEVRRNLLLCQKKVH